MLLMWARGVVFAYLNNFSYCCSSWWGLHWGALLRREKRSRLYLNYFEETPLWTIIKMELLKKMEDVEYNPEVKRIQQGSDKKKLYVFNKVAAQQDLFGPLREHQPILKMRIYNMLTAGMKKKLSRYTPSYIGVHIRRGDFKLSDQTTPDNYFIRGIQLIRNIAGEQIPVTVYTDAYADEMQELLSMPHVELASKKPDILDLLLLSQSKIMMLSRSSTFSYWAAFLSDAVVVRPSNDWQPLIKINAEKNGYHEIQWDYESDVSTDNFKRVIKEKYLLQAENVN